MAENPQSPGPGGFIIPSLPSPAPSNSTTRSVSGLPRPRGHALRPGSAKEDKVRQYVEEKLLHISRRYVKKFGIPDPADEVLGYKSMAELCKDLEALINIIWLSGTPSLQIPYLLNIANEFNTWLSSFSPSPPATFSVLTKLDHCFASLLIGQDIETKEDLPGFENGLRGGMSRTDMVRCKSTVEQTRILIVEVMTKEPADEEAGDNTDAMDTAEDSESATDSRGGFRGIWDEDDERFNMDVARVYENTLVQLGEAMGEGGGVGDIQITDD